MHKLYLSLAKQWRLKIWEQRTHTVLHKQLGKPVALKHWLKENFVWMVLREKWFEGEVEVKVIVKGTQSSWKTRETAKEHQGSFL